MLLMLKLSCTRSSKNFIENLAAAMSAKVSRDQQVLLIALEFAALTRDSPNDFRCLDTRLEMGTGGIDRCWKNLTDDTLFMAAAARALVCPCCVVLIGVAWGC